MMPSLVAIARSTVGIFATAEFYGNLQISALEVALSLVIGTVTGVFVGVLLGASRVLSRAYEPYIYYLGPTPRIIFLPIMIMLFGLGIGSKVALGALSCFFVLALISANSMRQINPTLIRVGRSLQAKPLQMVTKIYLPAMRAPILNGVRLGFGTAMLTCILAETKLSNAGLGFMLMQFYSQFNMPALYGMLVVIFVIAGMGNGALGRLADGRAR
ncbi:ABC transporter permease subunit [Rhizobium sp. P32RR-XVIII]|nr:ABC transporter permease subunit [Rhizobium sp. P32RR-XVIII]